jgi:XTP/dITP diphosphohydrolase
MMPEIHTIVLASANQGKLEELQRMLAPLELTVVLQQDFSVPEVAETGLSFVENAIIKARNACRYTQLPALADDSGLEVDALHGQPGIRSARYSGLGATDTSNNEKLLAALRDVGDGQRGARFRCVLALMRHAEDPCPLIVQGSWEGSILTQPRGNHGFGYDPLFLVPQHGCSAAELGPQLKSQLSHRAQAMRALVRQLRSLVAAAPAR